MGLTLADVYVTWSRERLPNQSFRNIKIGGGFRAVYMYLIISQNVWEVVSVLLPPNAFGLQHPYLNIAQGRMSSANTLFCTGSLAPTTKTLVDECRILSDCGAQIQGLWESLNRTAGRV